MTCPRCGSADAAKVIYLGFPMRLCDCSCLFGVWSFVIEWVPVATDGAWKFMAYDGAYLPALWAWLVGKG